MKTAAFFVVLIILAAPAFSLALGLERGKIPTGGNFDIQERTPTTVGGLADKIVLIVQIIYTVFFVVAIAIFLFVAFQYLFSQGDAAAVQKVHQWLIWGVVAVIVALLSVGVNLIIKDFVGG